MNTPNCPGQNQQYWRPEDIFEIPCPTCGTPIEFWKDDPLRSCPSCKTQVHNIRISMGCAKWCKHSTECLKTLGGTLPHDASVCVNILDSIERIFHGNATAMLRAKQRLGKVERLLETHHVNPLTVKAAALLLDLPDIQTARQLLDVTGVPAADGEQVIATIQGVRSGTKTDVPEVNLLMKLCDAEQK